MREIVAYLLSAALHVSVLGVLNSALDEPPQLLRVEMGRASIEAVAAHASQPVGVVDPDTALLDESVDEAESQPAPEEFDAETSSVTRQQPWLELARRDDARDEDTVPLPPPPAARPKLNEPLPQPVEPLVLEKKQAQLPKVEAVAEEVAQASVESTPSRAQAGAEDDDLPPALVSNPAPPYPPEARAAGHQGVVMLLVTVSPLGTVEKLSLYQSSGVATLDQAALAAVPHWRFQSGKRRGMPTQYDVRVPVRFSIRN
jgi:periplasmic protein TonB